MRRVAQHLRVMTFLAGAALGSAASGPEAAPAALTGRWAGAAKILANWMVANELPFDLTITPDGNVSGSIGDAVVSGEVSANRVITRMFVHSDFTLSLALTGALLAKDGISRKRFHLNVSLEDGRMFAFGASDGHASWPLASKASRVRGAKIQVAKFELRKQ